jgi:hypothetical protein
MRFSTTHTMTELAALTAARIAEIRARRATLSIANDKLRALAKPGPRRFVFTGAGRDLLP